MATLAVPLLIALVGLIIYGFAPGKASNAGLVAYACGLLVVTFALAGRAVHWP